MALAFLYLCRVHAGGSIGRWFSAVPLEGPLDFLSLFAAVLLAMVLHESGHLLMSLMLGFHILGGSVGPVQLQMLPGVWKVSWSWPTFFTASVSAIPGSMKHWRAAMILVVVAGPLTTLSTGLMVSHLHHGGPVWPVFQRCLVQVSALLFVLGLIPNSRYAPIHNDARLLLDLTRQNEGAEEMELKVRLKQLVVSGERPQDYPLELMQRVADWRGRPETQLVFAQAVVQWAIDSEDIERADAWDAYAIRLSNEFPGRMQNAVLASSACFDVIFRGDLEAARAKFSQVNPNALFPTCFEHRALACRHVAWGQLDRAPAHILRAQYALPRGVASYGLERTLLAKLHMQVLTATAHGGTKAIAASA
jgi:hypothetical protein